MKKISVAVAVFSLICLCSVQAASAQALLERLEKKVREQLKPPAGGTAKANKAAATSEGDTASVEKKAAEATEKQADPHAAEDAVAERGYLGIVTDDRQDRGRGVRILEVKPGSPGEKAGLQAQDLITDLGGIRVRQLSDLGAIFQQVPPGGKLVFDILRGDQRKKLEVTFGRRPPGAKEAVAHPGASPQEKPGGPELVVPSPPTPQPANPVPSTVPEEPPPAAAGVPPAPGASPQSDRARIEALERRVRQLEERLQQLERAMLEKR